MPSGLDALMAGAPAAGGGAGQTGGLAPFLQQLVARSGGAGMGGGMGGGMAGEMAGGMGGLAPYLQALTGGGGGAGGGFRDIARNALLSAQQNAEPLIGRQPFEVAEHDRPQVGIEKSQAEALESRLRDEMGGLQKELDRLRQAERTRQTRKRKAAREGGRG